jgi:hypothetical protein
VSMWAESPGYPGVHRFAAGAAKTGMYVNPKILTRMIMHLISNDWLIKLGYLNNL